jgi:tetratricopeptide (TPR) repeat protein
MRHAIFVGIFVMWSLGMAAADEITERKSAAIVLMNAWKNAEALAVFTNLAAMNLNDDQKSEVLENAAYCAFRLRHADPSMEAQAMELAKKIPIQGQSIKCRMVLLTENGRNNELVNQFSVADFASLPEEFAAQAFYMRGKAYALIKKGQEAEADFKMALDRSPGNEAYLMARAGNYFNNLKDTQQALDAYSLVIVSAKPPKRAVDATLEVARIHISVAKYGEALGALDNFKESKSFSDYQRIQILRTFGQVYAGLGREQEALASFAEANRIAGQK